MMNWLRACMQGRNGTDHLSIAQIALALLLNMLAGVLGWQWLSLVATIILVWACFRILSRNIVKRRAENHHFIHLWSHIRNHFSSQRDRARQGKEFRFFTCPSCKNKLRVPRGKGKLQITCPRCGQRFSGKT